jgi:hypothetical protein
MWRGQHWFSGWPAPFGAGGEHLRAVASPREEVDLPGHEGHGARNGGPRRFANIRTGDDALWWSVTTLTTVGYGDRFPVSAEGRAVAMLLMAAEARRRPRVARDSAPAPYCPAAPPYAARRSRLATSKIAPTGKRPLPGRGYQPASTGRSGGRRWRR